MSDVAIADLVNAGRNMSEYDLETVDLVGEYPKVNLFYHRKKPGEAIKYKHAYITTCT